MITPACGRFFTAFAETGRDKTVSILDWSLDKDKEVCHRCDMSAVLEISVVLSKKG